MAFEDMPTIEMEVDVEVSYGIVGLPFQSMVQRRIIAKTKEALKSKLVAPNSFRVRG